MKSPGGFARTISVTPNVINQSGRRLSFNLLGFTEPPAFFKAFKRWTGFTPREFQLGVASGSS